MKTYYAAIYWEDDIVTVYKLREKWGDASIDADRLKTYHSNDAELYEGDNEKPINRVQIIRFELED